MDDLAYQNVAPVRDLPEIRTVRQIASEFIHQGIATEGQADRIISVHSMSKTDSYAGARLAVIEIRDKKIRQRFDALNSQIQPNLAAIFLSYLFYRDTTQATRTYWHLRNSILYERTQALLRSEKDLPTDRNPFGLKIIPPTGSLYPLLHVEHLPAGLSLDWLTSSLARGGIGMLPLSTFARTEKGFETGRTTFRLTLGGKDNADVLHGKTRRLLIDLNRLIAEEDALYNRKKATFHISDKSRLRSPELLRTWDTFEKHLLETCKNSRSYQRSIKLHPLDNKRLQRDLLHSYIPERLEVFRNRLLDRSLIHDELMRKAQNDNGPWLINRLEREFMKDSLQKRQDHFKLRTYDRTVHPTQAYSLGVEMALDAVVTALIHKKPVAPERIEQATEELLKEYLGLNVSY